MSELPNSPRCAGASGSRLLVALGIGVAASVIVGAATYYSCRLFAPVASSILMQTIVAQVYALPASRYRDNIPSIAGPSAGDSSRFIPRLGSLIWSVAGDRCHFFSDIFLMSSTAGRSLSLASATYGAAQAATLMFMRHLALELGPFGIRANAIAPSIVRNERIDKYMPAEALARATEQLPSRRIGTPQDVAEAALFLASDASSWIAGHVLDVNGGKVMM